jgi:hypothetical protein
MTDVKTLWTRVAGQLPKKDPFLVGREISAHWLAGSLSVSRLQITGESRQVLSDLLSAARDKKLALPIASLRATLICRLDNLVSVDRDLGLNPRNRPEPCCAAEIYTPADEDVAGVRATFAQALAHWALNVVEPWAQRHGIGQATVRLHDSLRVEDVELVGDERKYLAEGRRPDFPVIVRSLAQQLIGETLFEGLGGCELVSSAEAPGNTVELMTMPQRPAGGDESFSMVARLTVATAPYSSSVYLLVSAAKRVWARRPPTLVPSPVKRATGYVMAPGCPAAPASIVLTRRDGKTSWEFGEDYDALVLESGRRLPATLAEAVAQRDFDPQAGWWAGVPELTTLYRSVSPRTVFEGDEAALLERVAALLDPIVSAKGAIAFQEVKPPKRAKPLQEMLRVSDFVAAGAVFGDDEHADEDEVDPDAAAEEEDPEQRERRLKLFREQNVKVLREAYGDHMPVIWSFCDLPEEAEVIKRTVEVLFGGAVEVRREPLPTGVHGLRQVLAKPDKSSRVRFEDRVQRWKQAAERMQLEAHGRHMIALICAPDVGLGPERNGKPQRQAEDAVNYFAGIHALCAVGANVHHVLPIAQDERDPKQNFLHRLQSAIMDVTLAHSGAVLEVGDFVRKHLPEHRVPKAIYGIQAVRSRARVRTGQSDAHFLLYSRTLVDNGLTQARLAAQSILLTDWMPLSDALAWVGAQRALCDSDARWLETAFKPTTRQCLNEIGKEDPQAIVLIDWGSVQRLWKGIRDEDLVASATPSLDNLKLPALGSDMTFVRLRRGDNTLSLRTAVQTQFEGWREQQGERASIGEIRTDTYVTTEARLVQLARAGGQGGEGAAKGAHFVGSPGYPKTVQVKRGLSCYRSRVRMSRLGKGLSEFGERILEVAATDAALPAPMDITVMCCPGDVAPESYAVIAMGLRVGYAHYSDWTALPTPLFFRKKIDDYVIRYPDDDSGEREETGLPDVETPDGAMPTLQDVAATPYVRMVVEETQGVRPPPALATQETQETQPAFGMAAPAEGQPDDLLARAKAVDLPEFAYSDDFRLRRLYQHMIRGDVRVRVELPGWVELSGLFISEYPPTKRLVQRCWERARQFQYVRPGERMRPPEEFLDWVAEKVRTPHACRAIVVVTHYLGTINFRGLISAIEERYNPMLKEEERVGVLIRGNQLADIARWANAAEDDEIAAWLVFLFAQLPLPEYRCVLDELTHIPGPRTAHALAYYLESAAAVAEVMSLKSNERRDIVRRLPPDLPLLALAVPQKAPVDPQPQPMPFAAAPSQDDPMMQVKSKATELLDALEPGSGTFDATLLAIREQLVRASELHARRLEEDGAARQLAQRMMTVQEKQRAVLESLRLADPSLSEVCTRDIPTELVDSAEAELAACEQACQQVHDLAGRLVQLEQSPKPAGLLERKRRNDAEQKLVSAALEAITRTRELIESGCCFTLPGVRPEGEAMDDRPPQEDARETAATGVQPGSDTLQREDPVNAAPEDGGAADAAAASVEQFPQAATPLSEKTGESLAPAAEESAKVIAAAAATAREAVAATEQAAALEAESESSEDSADIDASTVDAQAGTLVSLLRHRLYGLAKVHLQALEVMAESGGESLRVHHAVMNAMVGALDSMDCQFSFEQKLPELLSEVLAADRFPSDEVCDTAHLAMGILAAGLPNMLFDAGEVQWRIGNAVGTRLVDRPAVAALLDHLDVIRKRNYELTRDLFLRSQVSDTNAIDKELARYKTRAADWRDGAELFSAYNHRAFMAMHAQIFGPNFPIGRCLSLIAKGDFARLPQAIEDAKRAFAKPAQTIEDDFKRRKERTKPEGALRARAVENIVKTEKFVHSVSDLLMRRSSQNVELSRDMQSFMEALNQRLEGALRELQQASARNQLEQLYRTGACSAIECALRLFDPKELPRCIPDTSQRLLIQLPLGRDLLPALRNVDGNTPPLCAPANVFEETRMRALEPPTLDDPQSEDDINRALVDALHEHVAAKRFLPAFAIELLVPKASLPKAPWLAQLHLRERDMLEADLQEARTRVAHAMTLSALSQADTSRMQLLIGELLMLCQDAKHPIGTPQVASAAYPDFPQARAALRSNVLQPLEAGFTQARAKLEAELAEEETKVDRDPADIQRIRSILGSGNAANLRTAHDALRMLRTSGKLPAHANAGASLATVYEQYVTAVKRSTQANKQTLDALKDRLAAAPGENEPAWLQPLDGEQRGRAIELIEAWQQYFAARNPTQHSADRLFTLMGFPRVPQYYPEQARSGRARYMVDEQTFRLNTAAEDPLFIPPVLGSWCTHIQCFALFTDAQDSEIRQLTHETGETPTIVLVRTHLSMQRRARIGWDAPVLLVDDDLIAYMALHPEERLQTLVKVGMLTFRTNPYDDYNNKPVPSEMFFGRHQELNRLRDAKGMALLWGGRRLGKSSLLSQIERESREQGQEAVAVSMYTVSTAQDFVASAWSFIYRALAARHLVGNYAGPATDARAIAHHIETELIRKELKQLYLLIDEADDLMRCELGRRRDEPSFVRTLTQLADNVSHVCRVKIAIAGLHNMARMASDENTVFAKADPIALKPFTTPEDIQRGIRLVIKPLAAMGYSFGDDGEDLALRILSVCNFYPALIQLYCRRLVEHLHNARVNKAPPYRVEARDLESIERDSTLMSVLRDKFRYNLELDKRYKAIALILADEYYRATEVGGFEGLSVPDVRERCEAFFPLHFANLGGGVYEALLDEMSSLNIVEHMGSRYVLRNPNIAMMIGDPERVNHLMQELSHEPPETSRNRGERRLPMTRGNAHIVFPMPTSWVRNQLNAVTAAEGELIVLTGNALSGILDLASAHVGREEWKLPDGFFQSAPIRTPQNLLDMVTSQRRSWSAVRSDQEPIKPRVTVVRDQAWRVTEIPEYLPIAEKAVKAGMRVVLLAPPERALEIAQAIEANQLRLHGDGPRAWRVVPVPAWSEDAIYYWNQENVAIAENQQALEAIRMASCCFGKEVMNLCRSSLTLEEALAAPQQARSSLAANRDAFYQRIGLPLALNAEYRKAMENFLELMHGISRSNQADIEEARTAFGITEPMQQFFYWMGLLQEGPDNTWQLPTLYAQLLAQKEAAEVGA